MTDEKNYKKSKDLWVESQMILIAQLHLQKENAEANIKLNKASLKNTLKTIAHEEKMLNEFL